MSISRGLLNRSSFWMAILIVSMFCFADYSRSQDFQNDDMNQNGNLQEDMSEQNENYLPHEEAMEERRNEHDQDMGVDEGQQAELPPPVLEEHGSDTLPMSPPPQNTPRQRTPKLPPVAKPADSGSKKPSISSPISIGASGGPAEVNQSITSQGSTSTPPRDVISVEDRAKEFGGTVSDLKPTEDRVGADVVPDGQELVSIHFPEPTDINDIITAVSLWTGKNVIISPDVKGQIQMISPKKVTKVEAYQAFLSALNLLGLTTVETGKIIKIIPVASAVKSNLKTFMGSSWTPMTDELITQIVPLKYISASALQVTLSRIVSANSIIVYEPTNTLIVSDSGFKVKRILDIIALLDVKARRPQISVVPVKYGDAKTIANMVQEFSNQGGNTKTGGYMNTKVMTDERTNSVIIFGPPGMLSDTEELVKRFDVKVDDPSRQASIHVRPLEYVDATELATTLQALASSGSNRGNYRRPPVNTTAPKTPGAQSEVAAVAALSDDVKITADAASNSLLITGSRAAYEDINNLIRKLDVRQSQVFVESEIIDLNINGDFKFGSSIFAGSGKEEGTKMAYTWEAGSMAPLLEKQITQSTSTDSVTRAAGAFGEDLTIGVLLGTEVDIPGVGKISPGALIKMIKSDAYSNVLSSPHLLTSNNQEANITVGDVLYFKGATEATVTGTIQKPEKENVDLSLTIKPKISNSNYITLEINLTANTGSIDSVALLPVILKRQTKQIVTVKNSQTVVVSGLVKEEEREVYRKIPFLGDVPILGWLFRNSTIQKKKNNLMIFITPSIIHGANDLAAIYEKKVKERDEYLNLIYGSNYKENSLYQKLSKEEDGKYVQDHFDVIEGKNRQQRIDAMLRDAGYSSDDIQEMNSDKTM